VISSGTLTFLAVLIGAIYGAQQHVPDATRWLLPILLVAAAASWYCGRPRQCLAVAMAGFALGAALLAQHARQRATESPLRALLDARYGHFALDSLADEPASEPIPTRFEILEDAVAIGDIVALRAAVLEVDLAGRHVPLPREGVRLTVGGAVIAARMDDWRAGRIATAPVVFRRPARYFDEGVGDAERELALDGTALLGSIKSGLLVDLVSRGSRLDEAAARIRAHVRRAVGGFIGRGDPLAGAIVTAILIGDRTGLPDEIRTRLQAAGTYHVIAISGGNIALVAGLSLACLFVLRVPQRTAAAIAILVLLFHAGIVTAGPSVWRATITGVVYLAARVLDHRTPPWQAMAVAGVLIVLAHPLDATDPGFVLTFGATAALLDGGRRMSNALTVHVGAGTGGAGRRLWRRLCLWAAMSIAASAAIELALLPVSAVLFSRVSLAGVLLNLIAVPLMAIVQIAGTIVVCLSPAPSLANVVGRIAALAADWLVESARVVDVFPVLAPRVPAPAGVLILTYYGGLVVSIVSRRFRPVGITAILVAAGCIVTGRPASDAWTVGDHAGQLRLTMIDVGQGESMLLEAPEAPPLLIDAGGAPFGASGDEIGARVVTPALWARGVRRLGALLITHGDPDHMGGAASIIRDLSPPQLWMGILVPRHEPTLDLLRHAHDGHVVTEQLHSGTERQWGGVRLRVLNPPAPDWERPRVRNDDSVVFELLFGDVSILLTGDIGADVERALVPQLTPARVRILKVAHHGSRTSSSSALLEAWRPQVAIISCGRGNRFGHPTTEVLERLHDVGARVYRTDLDGEVTMETDGRQVRVHTWMEGHK
jgi:competence protein ComEC